MTNLYNLFPNNPKIIFLHGLNNNLDALHPLKIYFEHLGYDCQLIVLPGHGDGRKEAKDLKTAIEVFDQRMREVINGPYFVIAFSQGALFLQLWLEKNQAMRPYAQVLLAPALCLKKQNMMQKLTRLLPFFVPLPSQAPKKMRRYPFLYIWEYRTLMEGVKAFQSISQPFRLPTLVIVDSKDELVDARALEKFVLKMNGPKITVLILERSYLKKGFGQHHILFHPDYFRKDDWARFTLNIAQFFNLYKSTEDRSR